jgi:hypothetical protein
MPVLKRADLPRETQGDPVLVAALYDGGADDRRIELLYQDAPHDFGLFSTLGDGSQAFRALSFGEAKTWISRHGRRLTVIADVRGLCQRQDGASLPA